MPIPQFGGSYLDDKSTPQEIVDHVSTLQKTIEYHLSGQLDSTNAREFGGWGIQPTMLHSKSMNVGLFSGETDADDIRMWAGNPDRFKAPFRVHESGKIVVTNIEIQGGIIKWDTGSINGPAITDVSGLDPRLQQIDINGTYIGTLTASQINAVQGISLGANATILWDKLPTLPTVSQIGAKPASYVPTYAELTGVKPPNNANNTFNELLGNTNIRGFVPEPVTGAYLALSADYILAGSLIGRTVKTASAGPRVELHADYGDAYFHSSGGKFNIFDGLNGFLIGESNTDVYLYGKWHFQNGVTGIDTTARFG